MKKVFAYKKQYRITQSKEYALIFENGVKISGKFFKIHYLINFDDKTTKLGIIISKKIKGSVPRNRHKRFMREYYRLRRASIKNGANIVIVVYKSFFIDQNNEDITANLDYILGKADLFIKNNEKGSNSAD